MLGRKRKSGCRLTLRIQPRIPSQPEHNPFSRQKCFAAVKAIVKKEGPLLGILKGEAISEPPRITGPRRRTPWYLGNMRGGSVSMSLISYRRDDDAKFRAHTGRLTRNRSGVYCGRANIDCIMRSRNGLSTTEYEQDGRSCDEDSISRTHLCLLYHLSHRAAGESRLI